MEGLEGALGKSADSESSLSCLLVVTSCLSFLSSSVKWEPSRSPTSHHSHGLRREDEAVNRGVPCLAQRKCSVCKCDDRMTVA